MSINSPEQFEKLRACEMIVGKALRAMAAEVRAGVTTADLSLGMATAFAGSGGRK
jgi:methionine aminopeptidase